MKKRKYRISGMFCAACVGRVERAINALDGVDSCTVSLLTNDAEVAFKDEVDDEGVIAAVSGAGYGIALDYGESISKKRLERKKSLRKSLIRLIIGAVLSTLVMYFGMSDMMGWPGLGMDIDQSIALVLTVLAMALYFDYFYHGFKALIKLSPDMLSLVALGSLVSFAYSLYVYIEMMTGSHVGHSYFDSAAMIPVFVSIGKFLEAIAKAQSTSSLEALLALMPEKANLMENGEEREVEAASLKVGNICRVRPGGKIPSDGKIIEGYGNIEEAALSGEAAPIYKSVGDLVKGGSHNLTGSFLFEVTAVGEDTSLSQIAKMVERAASSKGKLAALADKVSRYFVPSIIAIAIIVFACWAIVTQDVEMAVRFGVSSLVVACPCALGLATPVAVMVGASRASSYGILFKDASAFENFASADSLVIDKTGTITDGHLTVILDKRIANEDRIGDIVYSLEDNSEHPLAWSLALYLEKNGAKKEDVTSFESLPGYGVKGVCLGHEVAIGNWALMAKEGLSLEKRLAKKEENEGVLVTYYSIDGELGGYFGALDKEKEGSQTAVDTFHKHGVSLYLASGDTPQRTAKLASNLSISHYYGAIKPEGKEELVVSLKKEGHKVAMLGDGINDAPAIKASDVGLGIGTGSDLALSSADVVLRDGSLDSLVKAYLLSRKVKSNIVMNLFWAFLYNVLLIPVAAGAFHYVGFDMEPMWASLSMALSSLFVILNALRLKWIRI